MTDQPPPPPGAPTGPVGGGGFCGECGSPLSPGATFCGSCGAAAGAAATAPGTPEGGGPPGGASTWTGVEPVVERPGDAGPAAPPPGPAGPPPAGPPPGGPTDTGGSGRSKGPLIALVALVVAALGVGAFFLFGSDDDDSASDDTTTTTEDPDETTTTTEDPDETTTSAPDETTTTLDAALEGIDFVPVTDATGALTVEVPSDWTDVSLELPNSGGLANIQASTDLDAFRSGFAVPGTSFSLFPTPPANPDLDQVLDFLAASVRLPENCTSLGKDDYTDGVFTGRFEVWTDCAGVGTQFVQIVASQADGRTIEINVQLTAEDPIEIATHIAETFLIID